jgi:hypothetical protein
VDFKPMTESVRYGTLGIVDPTLPESEGSRSISWIFSNEDVCLDMHTISTEGWVLDDYLRNPVLLFAHDQESPPIGRVTRIEKQGKLLVGDTVFADAETYAFADTIFRLIKGRYLNATSVSWFPLEFKPARDRNRPDGIDFLKQKLLEISVVPVPANPVALATARARGIDTGPLRLWAERILDLRPALAPGERANVEAVYAEAKMPARESKAANWKCGASRNLPLDDSSSWDGPAAQKAVFAACGFDGDKPDLSKARKAFLAYDAANPTLRGSYKLPFATIKDGRMVALASGIRAAASRLPQTDIPESVQDSARAVIDHYEEKMGTAKEGRAALKLSTRDLYTVAQLAYCLDMCSDMKARVDHEEAAEGDYESPDPANMLAVLQALGKALVEMAAEEVKECLAEHGPIEEELSEREMSKVLQLARGARLSAADKEKLDGIHAHCMRSAALVRAHIDHYKGEDLEDEDTRAAMFTHAEAIHDHCMRSAALLRAHIDGVSNPTSDPENHNPQGPIVGRNAGKDAKDADDAKRGEDERRNKAAILQAKQLIANA